MYPQHRHQASQSRICTNPCEVEFSHDWIGRLAEHCRSRLDFVSIRSTYILIKVEFGIHGKLKLASKGSFETGTDLTFTPSLTPHFLPIVLLVLVPSSREIDSSPFDAFDVIDGCKGERIWQIGLGMGSIDEQRCGLLVSRLPSFSLLETTELI